MLTLYCYCSLLTHTNKFLVFPGDLVGNTLTPVREVGRVDQSLGVRLGHLVAAQLGLGRESSNCWLEVTRNGEFASLDTMSQVCEECLSGGGGGGGGGEGEEMMSQGTEQVRG